MKAASRSDRDRAGVRNDVRHVLVTQARQMGRRKGEKLKHVSVMNAGLFRHVIPFKIQKKMTPRNFLPSVTIVSISSFIF